jgi:hypothetical protein
MHDTDLNHPLGGMSPINDFCRRNSVGRSFVYDQIRAGKLVAVKAGNKTLITYDEEIRWRNSLTQIVRRVERLSKRRPNRPSTVAA